MVSTYIDKSNPFSQFTNSNANLLQNTLRDTPANKEYFTIYLGIPSPRQTDTYNETITLSKSSTGVNFMAIAFEDGNTDFWERRHCFAGK